MGLPAIPYALPVIGHLHLLGNDHASAYAQLAERHGAPVFQICLGNKRAIVFNDFTSARQILQANASATIDRPQLYTFHGVVSSTQGFSIGSSPWDESCRRKRKLASATLSRAGIGNFLDMIDRESKRFLMAVKVQQSDSDATVSLKWPAQRYALSSSMKLCYGIEMEDADDALLSEVLEVGEAISLLRSASANRQDYVPFLRYLPNEKTRQSQVFRERRDIYLAGLMERGREAVRRGHAKPCISSAVLRDEEAALTAQEIGSICLSMISGGFEAIPSTLTMCCAALITPAGKSFQEAAYADIRRHYPTNQAAWQASLVEEEVPYVNALIKETLRHYTVTAMIPPRQTTVDIRWENGAVIPAGTMILVNAQAANHDVTHFGPSATNFDPTRWLDLTSPVPVEKKASASSVPILQHLGFGAGSRSCVGAAFAHRLLYTALVRLLLCYELEALPSALPETDFVEYNVAKEALVAHAKDFRVKLIKRMDVDSVLRI